MHVTGQRFKSEVLELAQRIIDLCKKEEFDETPSVSRVTKTPGMGASINERKPEKHRPR